MRPWVVDVTKDMKPAPSNGKNFIDYLGLFEGRNPDPEATPGYIMMQSSLVLEGTFTEDVELQAAS